MANYRRRPRVAPQKAQSTAPAVPTPPLEVAVEVAEPMHRYTHHIPAPLPQRYPSPDTQTSLDYIAAQLAEETQLLVDILGAVNALTAATLSNHRQNS